LGALRRTRIGNVSIAEAVGLDELEQLTADDIGQRWLDPLNALGLPSVDLTPREANEVRNGGSLSGAAEGLDNGSLVALAFEHRLVAIYQVRINGRLLLPKTIIPGGVAGAGG